MWLGWPIRALASNPQAGARDARGASEGPRDALRTDDDARGLRDWGNCCCVRADIALWLERPGDRATLRPSDEGRVFLVFFGLARKKNKREGPRVLGAQRHHQRSRIDRVGRGRGRLG